MLLLEIPSLTWSEELLRVVVAAGLGGAVGLERELREHEAGFRTHLLVSVGSASSRSSRRTASTSSWWARGTSSAPTRPGSPRRS